MSSDEIDLRHAIIEFYREEMRRRYLIENVRRFDLFQDVPDAQIDQLRRYFLGHIYPPMESRDRLDDALNRMADVIKSPRRLRPLMGAALASMWKLGKALPAALSAGNSTLDAYLHARKLEAVMVKTAEALGLGPEDYGNREKMIRVLADVQERQVMRLIKDIMKLFHALSNTKMLATAIEFLDTCTGIMAEKPELYTQSEIEGIRVGRELIEGGLALFLELKPEQFPRIIAGIEQIELDWYHRAKEEATRI